MSEDQIREVGKALLPYLRNDLTDVELGTACHDAVAALNRVAGIDRLRAEVERLKGEQLAEDYTADEIDRLRAENAALKDQVPKPLEPGDTDIRGWAAIEIKRLRSELTELAAKNFQHQAENGALRAEVAKLREAIELCSGSCGAILAKTAPLGKEE